MAKCVITNEFLIRMNVHARPIAGDMRRESVVRPEVGRLNFVYGVLFDRLWRLCAVGAGELQLLRRSFVEDMMPSTPRSDLRALGIIALGPQDHKDVRLSVDVVGTIQLNDWDERLDAVSRGLLGLSVACARCHDHKFDPIQQKDYYRLLSVFASTQRALRPFFDIDRDTETRFMNASRCAACSCIRMAPNPCARLS